MSACPPLNFSDVTPSAWVRVQAAAKPYGVVLTGTRGSSQSHGFTVNWLYDISGKKLQVQCQDSPWFIPCSAINDHLNQAIGTAVKTP